MLRIFTAYRWISRVWLARVEQRWNEDESSSVHRETVAFTMRVKTALLEKQQRQQRRQQQSCVNTSKNKVKLRNEKRLPKDRIWTMIPGWQTWRRYYTRLSSSSMPTSTPWSTSQLRSESKINWKENSRVRISRIAFTAEASNMQTGRYSCNPKTISWLFHNEWWITQRFLTRVQFIYTVGWARDHYSLADAWPVAKRKERKKLYGGCTHSYRKVYNLSLPWWAVHFVSTIMPAKQK